MLVPSLQVSLLNFLHYENISISFLCQFATVMLTEVKICLVTEAQINVIVNVPLRASIVIHVPICTITFQSVKITVTNLSSMIKVKNIEIFYQHSL